MQRGIPSSRGSFQSAVLAKIRNAKDLFGKSFSLFGKSFSLFVPISFWFDNLILGAHLFLGNEAGSGPHQIERMGLGACIHGRQSLKQGTGIFCGSGRCLWPENTWPDQRRCHWGLGSIW